MSKGPKFGANQAAIVETWDAIGHVDHGTRRADVGRWTHVLARKRKERKRERSRWGRANEETNDQIAAPPEEKGGAGSRSNTATRGVR